MQRGTKIGWRGRRGRRGQADGRIATGIAERPLGPEAADQAGPGHTPTASAATCACSVASGRLTASVPAGGWPAPAAVRIPLTAAADLDEAFLQQAERLRGRFGLTPRETEVAALLLAGRSRPYIRDELVISLHTVHTHARSILAKCAVHSQQELMDKARGL